MKYLLAFALVAVASAATVPEPVKLAESVAPFVESAPEAAQPDLLQPVQIADISPLMVPQEVMDDVTLLVKFVDTAENIEAPENYAPAPVDVSDFSVHVVDDVISPDTPIQIKLMDTPLPNSVVMPLGQFVTVVDAAEPEASDDLAVKVVDVADDEETPVYAPLALPEIEAEIADSPQEADGDFKVNFVDVAESINEAPYTPLESDIEAVEVVESLPEINEFAVKFVDLADVDEESPPYVIKQAPLPESVIQPFDAAEVAHSPVEASNGDFVVKVVDVAEQRFPKQYPDPSWR